MIRKIKDLYTQVISAYISNPLILLLLFIIGNISGLFTPILPRGFFMFFNLLFAGWIGFKYELVNKALQGEKIKDYIKFSKKYFSYWQALWPYYFFTIFISVIVAILGFIIVAFRARELPFGAMSLIASMNDNKNAMFGIFGIVIQYFKDSSQITRVFLKYVFISYIFGWSVTALLHYFEIVVIFFVLNRLKGLRKAFVNGATFVKEKFILLVLFFFSQSIVNSLLSIPWILYYQSDPNKDYLFRMIMFFLSTPMRIWTIIFNSALFLLIFNYLDEKKTSASFINKEKRLMTRDKAVLVLMLIASTLTFLMSKFVMEPKRQEQDEIRQEQRKSEFSSDIPFFEGSMITSSKGYKGSEYESDTATIVFKDSVKKEELLSFYQINLMNEGWSIGSADEYESEKTVLRAKKDNKVFELLVKKENAEKLIEIEVVEIRYPRG